VSEENANGAACRAGARSVRAMIWHLAVLAVVAVLTMVLFVGRTEVWLPDEARFGLAGRQMFETGEYLVPQLNLRPYTNKPPFFMWMQAASAHLIGRFDSTAARLPAALPGLALVILTYLFARMLTTPRGAFLSGVVFATSALPVLMARTGVSDMLLALMIVSAIMLLYVAQQTSRPTLCMTGAFVMMAFGVLVKGPVALVVPLAVGVGIALATGRMRHLSRAYVLPGFVLMVLIVAAWVVPACYRGGGYYTTKLILTEGIERAFARRNIRPFDAFYYIPVMLWGIFPWTFLFIPAVLAPLKRPERRQQRSMLVPLVWCAAVFVLFSAMHGKRHPYILPLFPAAAILVGDFLDRCARGSCRKLARYLNLALGAVTLAVAGLLAFGYARMGLSIPKVLPCVGLLAAAGVGILLASRSPLKMAAVTVAALTAVYVWGFAVVMPSLEAFRPARTFSAVIDRHLPADARMVAYEYGSHLYNFYLRRIIPECEELHELAEFLRGPLPAYCLMRTKEFLKLPANFRNRFEVVAREAVPLRNYNMILVRVRGPGVDAVGEKPIIITGGGPPSASRSDD